MATPRTTALRVDAIALSDSGKPIFSTLETEADDSSGEIARICGLLQAVRANVLYNSSSNDNNHIGELQSLKTESSTRIVFKSIGSIVLVAIAKSASVAPVDCQNTAPDAYLQLCLEYLYSQFLMTLTDRVQYVLEHNPSLDVQEMLGSTGTMRALWNDMQDNPGPYLTAAVQVVFPLSAEARNHASTVLQRIGDNRETPNTVFAMLYLRHEVVTLIQPSYRPHQMRVADLHLLLNFLNRQPVENELWQPICLPRFNPSGFLHCYTHQLVPENGLALALISQNGSTEQFQAFHTAAIRIRRWLGIPVEQANVLEILSTAHNQNDVNWRRNIENTSSAHHNDEDEYELIPYGGEEQSTLLSELEALQNGQRKKALVSEYLQIGVLHFLFRRDVVISDVTTEKRVINRSQSSHFVQCISSPVNSSISKAKLWDCYETLSLRLRLGSASVESVSSALERIGLEGRHGKLSQYCRAMCLLESTPSIQSVSYIKEVSGTYLAMNGNGFELYLLASNALVVEEAAAAGAALVKRLLADDNILFLTSPMCWTV